MNIDLNLTSQKEQVLRKDSVLDKNEVHLN